jgi:hypothetical protein
MGLIRWTSKSLRHLSQELDGLDHSACPHVIADCLRELGYSLQADSKTREGSGHVDRDAQFQYISDQAKAFVAAGEPAISVDTKKKELVGNFKNNGREWRPKGSPEAVNVHDVSIGTDHDTASFAVHAIGRWWHLLVPGGRWHTVMGTLKPLRSFKIIVQLIAATTTNAGLTVRAELDENKYPKGVKISDSTFDSLNLARHAFHGDWNYTTSPAPN